MGEGTLRRPHPQFSRPNRRDEGPSVRRAPRSAREPLMKPRDQIGVLWDDFRDV